MWLENEKVKEIDTAVLRGERRSLARILSEFFAPADRPPARPQGCPHCGKELVRQSLPYLEYLVNACPDRHGVWISPEVSDKMRRFMNEQIHEATKRQRAHQSLYVFVILGVIGFFVAVSTPSTRGTDGAASSAPSDASTGSEISPMPVSSPAFTLPAEQDYFLSLAALLEEGFAGRAAYDQYLQGRHGVEDYWGGFEQYRKIHQRFLARLRAVSVPERLGAFHAHILRGAEGHMPFYASYTEAKVYNRSARLKDLADHPALEAAKRELLAAYALLGQLYPNLDSLTRDALESRLRWLRIL